MRATITMVIDTTSTQHLTAARDATQRCLEDQGIHVTNANAGIDETRWTVIGAIKGKPEETWREIVYATDAAAAKDLCLKADSKRTVVAVLAGEVGVAA